MYRKWIEKNVKNCYGKCKEFCNEMQEVFPELILIRGFYYCPMWGEREHWWLVTEDNKIIDPTVSQFPTKGVAAEYIEWIEGTPELTGKCLNCGDYTYNQHSFCCEICNNEYVEYMKEFV